MIKQELQTANLISRHLSGFITPEEELELKKWREESSENEKLFQDLSDTENLVAYIRNSSKYDTQQGWESFNRKLRSHQRRRRLIAGSKYAAIFIIPIVIGLLLMTTFLPDLSENESVAQQINKNHIQILPGEKKATLTLDSGEEIDLMSSQEKVMAEKDGTEILIDSTALNYYSTLAVAEVEKEIYNKVDVPRGGEYSLTLSDGTKISLNSMSSLRFPVRFIGSKRIVELQGEAYFEVAKDTKPFIVKVNNVEVEVLGTTFNVSAYSGETCHTTLVEGSVRVQSATGNSCVLKPSQQAYIRPGSDNLNVRTVDIHQYISWVNGKISFKDQRLEDIMSSLSRWYDMQVFYIDPSLKNMRFGCNLNRYSDITPFLDLLERTEKINIDIKGKTITFNNSSY